MKNNKLIKGQLLVAEPSVLGDVCFDRSVILLADYNDEGAIGFILNKPLKFTINDLIPNVYAEFNIYNGGPVDQQSLYFIHNIPNLILKSILIYDGIYWGGEFDTVVKLINNNQINEDNIRFFLGYTGWNANQLKDEIEMNTWVICDNNISNDKFFGNESQSLWKEKLIELGGKYLIWSSAPENPSSN